MKKTVKKNLVEKASELNKIIQERKELEKREKELKSFFKTLIDNSGALSVGDYLITLNEASRTNLNKTMLEKHFGDGLKEFQTTTNYIKFDIKMVA